MADKRRQFTREFRLEAIRLVVEEKKPVAEVARQLRIRPDMLRTWRRQLEGRAGLSAEEAFPGHGHPAAPEEEVRRPRREVERLRQERDFLKNVWLRRRSQLPNAICWHKAGRMQQMYPASLW